jgi:putative endonuclease
MKGRTKTATAKSQDEAGLSKFFQNPVTNCALAFVGTNRRGRLMNFHYVYILISESDPSRHYTGITQDLENRLKAHNNGQVPHTAKFRPWRIETALAFRSREKAAEFEKYLKSHSGRAFAAKHL